MKHKILLINFVHMYDYNLAANKLYKCPRVLLLFL